ncbi:unnamed protein product, partial [Protopolystoma xenopodis]
TINHSPTFAVTSDERDRIELLTPSSPLTHSLDVSGTISRRHCSAACGESPLSPAPPGSSRDGPMLRQQPAIQVQLQLSENSQHLDIMIKHARALVSFDKF